MIFTDPINLIINKAKFVKILSSFNHSRTSQVKSFILIQKILQHLSLQFQQTIKIVIAHNILKFITLLE